MDNRIPVRLTLVSASPRRRELLKRLEIPFDVCPSSAAERWLAPDMRSLAAGNARRKVERSDLYQAPHKLLLGADTVVVLGSRVFGKPAGIDSARRMLTALSGRIHQVITGICLAGPGQHTSDPLVQITDAAVSEVRFRELTEWEINSYLNSGEWQGKAGAYAIQESGHGLVAQLDGDFDNVVGLPVLRVHELLHHHFRHCRFL